MSRFIELLSRFRKDEGGAFMVLFAVLAIVLIAVSGSVVDFTYMQTSRTRAQTALDSAALALQTRIGTDSNAVLKTKAQALLTERVNDASITATVNTVTTDSSAGKINIQASLKVPTAFIQLVGIHSITSQLTSEVTRGSKDVEVSLALDTTQSMSGSKISDLIDATNDLIDLVVQTSQTPTYSKMAIIPWSNAVNVGSTYANNVRGTPTPATTITAAGWRTGSAITITGITKASPPVVTTSTTHGLVAGDYVYIDSVAGMTQINDKIYRVGTVSTTKKFALLTTSGGSINTNNGSYSTYSSGGKVGKCTTGSSCNVVVTSAGHGLSNGNYVHILNVKGMTGLNDSTTTAHAVGTTTSSTFVVSDEDATDSNIGFNDYTSSGTAYCAQYGCLYYYFANASGSRTLYQPNNCATERTTNPYTDTAPSTTSLGFNYTSSAASCITQTIQPLTSNKTTLHNLTNTLSAQGSTAGHLGLAWGWYMISPNFGYLWPTASQPAAYGRANLVKAVVLMTDGQFNLQYCNGVLDNDSGNGTSHAACNSANGDSRTQAEALCDAIKTPANDTILYTVGFDLGTDTDSLNFLRDCASSTADFYQADTGADLDTAFQAIAQNLNDLRISK